MKLTPNFSRDEFVISQTAIRGGIDNTPPPAAWANLTALCTNVLEPAHDALGPIIVSSGYRSPMLNVVVGGALHSQHMSGEAADITAKNCSLGNLYRWLSENTPFDQLIWEFGAWVHTSHRLDGPQRGERLLAWRHDGKTRYVPLDSDQISSL